MALTPQSSIRDFLPRSPLVILLALLLILNGTRLWHRKHQFAGVADGFLPRQVPGLSQDLPGPDTILNPTPAMRQRLEAVLQKLPEEQRKAFQDRIEQDRNFFASIQNLPEEEHRKKVAEYLAQNPPPPGFDPANGGPDFAGSGWPGDKGAFPIPPPSERRSLDRQVANAQNE